MLESLSASPASRATRSPPVGRMELGRMEPPLPTEDCIETAQLCEGLIETPSQLTRVAPFCFVGTGRLGYWGGMTRVPTANGVSPMESKSLTLCVFHFSTC